ncbi:hypothetical protein DFP72DRAFT_1165834 [Ephemerocybe angulata]|uniref:Nephrocystin 3-like N-terminal domain-containing protein n=1 Tax=Ephemerocybe angulata TaxID=980116 RepID=A0A8H6IBH3_9AGAR|nr:hypothetical protein DFP72DRAFT_1165834 [Tulosesus angulatus]
MDADLQVARGHMDVEQPQGGSQFFSGASNITARDIAVHTAGRDMINNIVVNPAPISASIEEVMAWLKGANFRAIYRVSLETRMDDTGNWFIATVEFGEFVRQKGTVVWATGLPGSGKTILASISVEHLEDTFSRRSDVAILYAFLRYSEKPTLLQIIAGLLTQLVSCHNIALAHLLPAYKHAKTHRDELSCSEAVKLLRGSLGLFSETFIVIDGLDEVDDATKDGLLRVLILLDAHILFTCRPLELFKRRYTPQALHILVQAQTKDIEVYVAERIKESATLASILSAHPDVAERFTSLIKEKSNGMFLLARLQMELVLERCANIGSLLKALETLPSGIHDMYRLTMDRISSLSEEKVSVAHRAFIWILRANEDLSPEDLQHALTFSYEKKKFVEDDSVSIPVLFSICCGLVTVEYNDGKRVVRFIHYSTQEFMRGLVFSHLPDPHDLLAVTSVACVETHLEMLTAALKSATQKSAGKNWVSVSDVTQHLPLLHYALHNWGHHAKICDDQRSLSPFIHSFLLKYRTYAISNRSGSLSEVSPGLSLAAAYDLVNLISSRTFPYSPTHGTKTPFHIAAKHGHTAALRALLANYSGVHVKDEVGRTPLHHCVLREAAWEPEVVRQLLNLSSSDTWRAFPTEVVDINAQDDQGYSAFFEACLSPQLAVELHNPGPQAMILRLFTSHPGIDVDLPDPNGDTPFSRTCANWMDSVPHFLMSSIPNLKVDTRNKWGETPFMHACDSLSGTRVKWFLSRNPGGCHFPHQEDDEGNTALERVVAYEGRVTESNRNPHLSLLERRDYRDLGAGDGAAKIVRILSQHESHVRMVRAGHESLPIYQLRTSKPQQSPTVHVRLNDSHRRYEDERTSLMLLANSPAAVKYLVSENENNPDFINAQDRDGRCALMYACFAQDPVDALLSVKILTPCPSLDVHLHDRDGMSALDYAVHSNNYGALKILLQHWSWNPPAIRSAVITAAQKVIIEPEGLGWLLMEERVRDAFSSPGADLMPVDGSPLITALRRRADCKEMLETHEVFRDPIFRLVLGGGRTLAAIRQATIAAVNNPLISIEQLESHFGQKEVKDAFVWDIDVRDPDTILLINCLAWRSGCSALFDDLFGPLKRCEGRHRACVHALIQFN